MRTLVLCALDAQSTRVHCPFSPCICIGRLFGEGSVTGSRVLRQVSLAMSRAANTPMTLVSPAVPVYDPPLLENQTSKLLVQVTTRELLYMFVQIRNEIVGRSFQMRLGTKFRA